MKKRKFSTKILYLDYNEDREGGEALDDADWSDHAPAHISFNLINILKYKEHIGRGWSEEIEVSEEIFNSKTVFLVVVRYSDGDTFGTTFGHWNIMAVYNLKTKARQLKERIENNKLEKTDKYGDWKTKPWTGYFASLEGVEIHEMPVIEGVI